MSVSWSDPVCLTCNACHIPSGSGGVCSPRFPMGKECVEDWEAGSSRENSGVERDPSSSGSSCCLKCVGASLRNKVGLKFKLYKRKSGKSGNKSPSLMTY